MQVRKPTRIWPLTLFLLLLGSRPAPAQWASPVEEELVREMADFGAIVLEEMDPDCSGVCLRREPDDHVQSACYPLAYLYSCMPPRQAFYGEQKARDAAIAIADRIVISRTTLEWPLYNLCQVLDLLREELGAERISWWKEYARYYVSIRGNRPFFYTSFNHEAWNALAILRAGQVFKEPEWVALAKRLMHQLLKVQTKLGYFDEGPHHGPSLKYNKVQLAAMLIFHDLTGDREVLDASKKLADFIIRYSFPDGTPMSTFDGRQNYWLGSYGGLYYGLDRWPEGKQLNRRLFATRKRRGLLDPTNPYYELSDFYAYFGYGFKVDEYLSLRPEAPMAPLPQDTNGYRMVESGRTFSGGYVRQHDWIVAMSAIESNIPKIEKAPWRNTRQSRLDVWHEKTGLIIGGGHSERDAETPLANFLVVTGYKGIGSDFGLIRGGGILDKMALYFPIHVEADLQPARQVLTESYGEGDVSFVVKPLDENRLAIDYRYDVFGVKKLFVQLPLIIFHTSKVLVDGSPLGEDSLRRVNREVMVRDSLMGTTVKITIPEGRRSALRGPILPLRWYTGKHGKQRYRPIYHMELLSVEVDPSGGAGGGKFLVEIED